MLSLLLLLYWTFTKIGLFTLGGGYAMIPLMEAEIINRYGWLTAPEFLDILAIAEMTPGPVAINTASFVGFRVAGIAGSALATLGVVTPSLVILLLLGCFLQQLIRNPRATLFLKGLHPAVIALICLAVFSLGQEALTDLTTALIAAVFLAVNLMRKLSPFLIIGLGALLGLLFFPY